MANYLVTGVGGFIGSKFAEFLLNRGDFVVGIDNLSTGFLEVVPKGTEFIKAHLQDITLYPKLKEYKFDAIIHIAGQSGGEPSFHDPVYDLQSNTQSTLLLLNLAREIDCKKVLYASTVSVYGAIENPIDIIELNHTLPKSFYGVGKLASENYLRIYSENFGINTAALRLFNTYGAGQNLENMQQGMVSIFLAQALKNNHIHVKGSGDRYRDLIHVSDVVNAFAILCDTEFLGNKVYNISTGVATKVESLVEVIVKHFPNKLEVTYSGSTPGDVHGYTGSSALFAKETGWSPKVTLDQGIGEMVKWGLDKFGIKR